MNTSAAMNLKEGKLETTERDLEFALEVWSQVVGPENVHVANEVRDAYARSTMPTATRPAAVLKPSSTEEVCQIAKVASRYHVPIYPISRGNNWGLGSACAVGDGQVIVDLRRMNRIHEVNAELAYAVVEPGVTQGQLFEHLTANEIPLWMDATGAGPDASIIGNLMERGYGHSLNGDRFHNSCGYEVVLASGDVINTGFGHFESSRVTNVFKTGIGPSLDGLFTQSNLGIVTKATIWLMPKPSHFEAFAFRVSGEDELGAIIEALRPLRMAGIIQSATHIANDLRVLSSHMQYPWELTDGATPLPQKLRDSLRKQRGLGAWNVLGGLYGNRATVAAAKKSLRHALKSVARPVFISERKLRWAQRLSKVCQKIGVGGRLSETVSSVQSVYELLIGNPVADHLSGTGWRSRQPMKARGRGSNPLENGDGLIWLTPVVPMTASAADDLLKLITPIFKQFSFELLITFVSVNARAMCCPITVSYDKQSPDEATRAAQCYSALVAAVMARGYIPYRTGIQSMGKLFGGTSVYGDLLTEIKHTVDPSNILSPGRYSRP